MDSPEKLVSVSQFLLRVTIESAIEYVIVVPASGAASFYKDASNFCQVLYVTREEEGVALASGLALGGKSVVVCIQQSGVGNCLNAVFTLADAYQIHFPILVLDRGVLDENPVQRISSKMTGIILEPLSSREVNIDYKGIQACVDLMSARHRWIILHSQ